MFSSCMNEIARSTSGPGFRRNSIRRLLAAAAILVIIRLMATDSGGASASAAQPASAANVAGPRVPERDDEVLETLPRRMLEGRERIQRMRRELAARPDDSAMAARVADEFARLARASDDPRLFGHARSAIARWWDDPDAPSDILLIRAKLKETDHDYRSALADLAVLLAREPGQGQALRVQALVDTASLALVVADFERAASAADALERAAGPLQAMFARAPVLARTGRAGEAYDLYGRHMATVRERMPGAVAWVETARGEIAEMLGRVDEAERHYRAALAVDRNDRYLLRALADHLLDRGRASDVVELLETHTADTGVLLAYAIAARRSGKAEIAVRSTAELAERFAAIRHRQGTRHFRFESRYELELAGEPARALELAKQGWAEQKEPRDARNVLEAALAAGDAGAASPVIDFIAQTRIEDVRLRELAGRLGGR